MSRGTLRGTVGVLSGHSKGCRCGYVVFTLSLAHGVVLYGVVLGVHYGVLRGLYGYSEYTNRVLSQVVERGSAYAAHITRIALAPTRVEVRSQRTL